jgi:hypothetical protein|tara:strand:- start:408 stop:617 length:210 start_codon:yes stop_codon:yes gene_type:complete
MTKFHESFIFAVQKYWEDNKGKFKHTEESGVHKKMNVDKKFGLQDLADHFDITISQARRIVYVKNKMVK